MKDQYVPTEDELRRIRALPRDLLKDTFAAWSLGYPNRDCAARSTLQSYSATEHGMGAAAFNDAGNLRYGWSFYAPVVVACQTNRIGWVVGLQWGAKMVNRMHARQNDNGRHGKGPWQASRRGSRGLRCLAA